MLPNESKFSQNTKDNEVPPKALTVRSNSLFAWIWDALPRFIRVFSRIARQSPRVTEFLE
jgi:hypothetical protein